MKIGKLTIQNFRKFESQSFVFNPHFTVLIGENATGKTQILDALSIILGIHQSNILQKKSFIPNITNEAVRICDHVYMEAGKKHIRREAQCPVSLMADVTYHKEPFNLICTKRSEKGRTSFSSTDKSFLKQVKTECEKVMKGEAVNLPLLAYYGSGRVWPLKRHFKTSSLVNSRTDGYVDSLNPNTDVKAIQGWIRQQELVQLQKETVQTSFVLLNQAMAVLIPKCSRVYYDMEYDSVYLEFTDGTSCPFYSISDGYRCMVTMVTDMVRRIWQLNPQYGENALRETDGVVLVDELDLYLHPKWQRFVVDNLKTIFPKIQFIVTTHSPFIIQSLSAGEVIDLSYTRQDTDNILTEYAQQKQVAFPGPGNEYVNRSIEDITEGLMGIPVPQRSQRYQKMYDAAKEYYNILHSSRAVTSEEKEEKKKKLDECSAPFSDDVAYHAFLEMERLALMAGETKTV